MLEMPERRWESLDTGFIIALPRTKYRFNEVTTWVNRLSIKVHFIKNKITQKSFDVSDSFFETF